MNDRDYWADVAKGSEQSRAERLKKDADNNPRGLRRKNYPKAKARRKKR